jgi:hypothetical protein
LLLTLLVIAGYGAYAHFSAGSTSTSASGPVSSSDGAALMDHSVGAGFIAITLGLGERNLKDQYTVRDAINGQITSVRDDRAQLVALQGTTQGVRATALQTAIDASNRLETAMAQWRDALFNLRFGSIDSGQTAINSAMTDLAQARDSWKQAGA